MTLRDQLRTHKGTFANWPPIWTTSRDPTDKPRREIGTLQHVSMNEPDGDIDLRNRHQSSTKGR